MTQIDFVLSEELAKDTAHVRRGDKKRCLLCGQQIHVGCFGVCACCGPAWQGALRGVDRWLASRGAGRVLQQRRLQCEQLYEEAWGRRHDDPPHDDRAERVRHVLQIETDGISLSTLRERFGMHGDDIRAIAKTAGLEHRIVPDCLDYVPLLQRLRETGPSSTSFAGSTTQSASDLRREQRLAIVRDRIAREEDDGR